MALLALPVELSRSALEPIAVLSTPVGLLLSALSPRKVLLLVRSQPC